MEQGLLEEDETIKKYVVISVIKIAPFYLLSTAINVKI